MVTWAGTWTAELVTATPYDASNGVRGVIDLDIMGDVTVNTPSVEESGTFSVWWKNVDRNTLTFSGGPMQTFGGSIVTTFDTTLRDGLVGFVWSGAAWLVSDFNAFDVPLGVQAGVTFEPRNTNGLCVLEDAYNIVSVERTAEGVWLATTDGTDITGRIIMPVLNTIGHAANMHPAWTLQDKTATTVELLTGLRNPGGPFNADDLDQDASNTISILISRLA